MRIILARTSITSGLAALLLPKTCMLKAPILKVPLSVDRLPSVIGSCDGDLPLCSRWGREEFPSIIGSCDGIGVGITSGVGVGVGVGAGVSAGVGGDLEGGLQTLQGR